MEIQQKLTDFFIVQSTWIVGLVIGLSAGGLAMAIERAVALIASTELARKLQARVRRFIRARILMRANRILAARGRGQDFRRNFRSGSTRHA